MSIITVGSRVRIERDETRYPSKGTWPQFRGKTGTVVEINLGEYGVVFGKARSPRPNGSIAMAEAVWFQPHEIRALAPERALSGPRRTSLMARKGKGLFDRSPSTNEPKVMVTR